MDSLLTDKNANATPRQSMAKIKEKVFINNWVELPWVRSTVQKKNTWKNRTIIHVYRFSIDTFTRYRYICIYIYISSCVYVSLSSTYLYSPILSIISVFIAHHNTIRKICSPLTRNNNENWEKLENEIDFLISDNAATKRMENSWENRENLPLGISDQIRGEEGGEMEIGFGFFEGRETERGKRFRGG